MIFFLIHPFLIMTLKSHTLAGHNAIGLLLTCTKSNEYGNDVESRNDIIILFLLC